MKNLMNKIWKKEEGFTLIELIIVIAILAIIAAIAIPNVLSAVDNSRKTTDISNAKLIADAAATVRAQQESLSAETLTDVLIDGDGSASAYETAIINQLNGVAPTLKFKGTTLAGGDYFMVNVTSDGAISVFSTNGSNAEATELFPTTDTGYTE